MISDQLSWSGPSMRTLHYADKTKDARDAAMSTDHDTVRRLRRQDRDTQGEMAKVVAAIEGVDLGLNSTAGHDGGARDISCIGLRWS